MSKANVEFIRASFEAFNEGGTDAYMPYVHPDVEFSTPAELASEPDTYRGHAGVRRYWDSFFEIMEDIKVEPLALHDWGDELVVIEMRLKARGRATGLEVEQRATAVSVLADGKAIGVSFHTTIKEAEAEAEKQGGTRPA